VTATADIGTSAANDSVQSWCDIRSAGVQCRAAATSMGGSLTP